MDKSVIIIKRNLQGQETWRYSGTIVEQDDQQVLLEAFFNRPDTPFHEITLNQGDRFMETYYTNRWYNIFAIYDRLDGHLKGWYCNLSYPATVEDGKISYVDLALDLLVYPDGRQIVLDQDEYDSLNLPADARQQVSKALVELKDYFTEIIPQSNPNNLKN